MTFFGQMLRPGERTRPTRQNASLVCFLFEGSGYSVVGGKRLDWQPFDTVSVPGGEWCEHVNGSENDEAILFVGQRRADAEGAGLLHAPRPHRRRRRGADRLIASPARQERLAVETRR